MLSGLISNPKNPLCQHGDAFMACLSQDARWTLDDELLFQVASFTFYGYCFYIGRVLAFLDSAEIDDYVLEKLVALGGAERYVSGLVARAAEDFRTAPQQDVYSQLIGIGHDYAITQEMAQAVESIFANTAIIAAQRGVEQ